MEFSVKGMTFKLDELQELSVSDLKVNSIARNHLFFVLPKVKKCLLVLRAGEIITPEIIKKYASQKVNCIYEYSIASEELIDEYKVIWANLKNTNSQKKQLELKDELLLKFMQDNKSGSEHSILSFVISCYEEFIHMPIELVLNYQSKSYLMFTRGLLLGSFSVL